MAKSFLLTGAALSCLVTAATPTIAQAQTDDFLLEEIIVTARKRNETIQDVPLAVTAISPSQLEDAFAQDIQDLEGRTPNLILDPVAAGPRGAAIAIRGVSFEDIEKSFDPAVGVIIDGVYIGSNTGQLLNPFDFELVEVLRGPQGTLFGKNTTGGVINVRRTRPTGEFGGRAMINVGEFGRREAQVVLNAPVIQDVLAVKGSFFLQKFDGYYFNPTLNTDAGEVDFWHGSLTALFTPNEDLSVQVIYDRMRDRGETVVSPLSQTPNPAVFGFPTNDLICAGPLILPPGVPPAAAGFAPANQCDRTTGEDLYETFANALGPVEDDINAITAEITWSIGEFELVSITGWRDQEEDVSQDFDASSADFFYTRRLQNYHQFSQEIRLSGKLTDALDTMLGLYLFDNGYELTQFTRLGPAPGQGNIVNLNPTTDHDVRSYAIFADANYAITENWRVNGGIRWTYEEKEITRTDGVVIDPTFDIIADGGMPTAARLQTSTVSAEDDWSEFTWRVSTDYSFTEDLLGYASVARGFRSGGFNGRANTAFSIGPYDPEFVTSWEVGAKSDWLNGRLRVNFSAFVSNYKNKQEEVVRPTPPGSANPQETVVDNAANANIKGLEFEVTALVAEGFTIISALGLLDADYENFSKDLNGDLIDDDASSLEMRRTPDVTFSISGNYEREIGPGTANLNVSYRYLDSYFTSIVLDPSVVAPGGPGGSGILVRDPINDLRSQTDSQNLLDISLSYKFDLGGVGVKASVYGRNMLDDIGLGSTLPVAGLFTFGSARPPRQFGGALELSF